MAQQHKWAIQCPSYWYTLEKRDRRQIKYRH